MAEVSQAAQSVPAATLAQQRGRSGWTIFWSRFRRNRLAGVVAAYLVAIYVLAILAPWISPHPPNEVNIRAKHRPPGGEDPQGLLVVPPASRGRAPGRHFGRTCKGFFQAQERQPAVTHRRREPVLPAATRRAAQPAMADGGDWETF